VAAAVVVCALALVETPSAAAPVSVPQEDGENLALEAGLRALREGDAALAVTFLRSSAAGKDDLEGEAWIGLGVAYRNLGRPASAATALGRSEEKITEPLLGWVRLERARLLIAAGEPDRADSLLAELSPDPDGSPVSNARVSPPVIEEVLEFRLERAVASGDEVQERALIERIVALGIGNAAAYASRLAELVQSEDDEEAGRLRRLALELPGSDEARGRSAAALLDDTESLNAGELLESGRILFGLASWNAAADAFRQALDRAETARERDEARYRLGMSLYRMRSWAEAARILTESEDTSSRYRTSAGYYAALAISSSSPRRIGAEALVAFADRYPSSRWTPRALKLAGDRLISVDREAAGTIYSRLIESNPAYWENARILFSLGEGARDAGELEEARAWFVELGRGIHYPQEKAQGWFWAARMAAAAGDSALTASYLERAGERYPYTYYGVRALGELGRTLPEPPVKPQEIVYGPLVVPEWADAPKEAPIEAAVVLLRTGLTRAGETQLMYAVTGRSFSREHLYDLWTQAVEGEAFAAATRLGERLLSFGRWDEEDPRYLNLRFPLYFVDLIEPVARQHELDPYLILALIKQESAFLPEARSYVGARGLMQLMPETAEEWRRRLRLPSFETEELYNPEINLSLGIPYLAHLVNRFGGSTEKALAAYNGGPTSVRRWERSLRDNRPETFIESIGYPETRTFVLTIMNNYYRYRYLWSLQAE